MRAVLLTVVALGGLAIAGAADDKPKTDEQLFQGSWDWDPKAKRSEAKPLTVLEQVAVESRTLAFSYSRDGVGWTMTTEFKLDPKATPKEIDLTLTDPVTNKVTTFRGVYEVKPGALRFCYRSAKSSRPKSFDDVHDEKTNESTQFFTLVPTPKR
jgi:uncharacterized protein (TIGR03067 family)